VNIANHARMPRTGVTGISCAIGGSDRQLAHAVRTHNLIDGRRVKKAEHSGHMQDQELLALHSAVVVDINHTECVVM